MKIKSLLSLLVCGVASQLMVGCASTSQYYDFSVPTAAHQKAAPAKTVTSVAQAETLAEPTPVAESETAPLTLETNVAKPTASAAAARTAPLTTAAVAKTVSDKSVNNNFAEVVTAAKTNKVFKKVSNKLKSEVREAKKANAVNGYIKIGLILILIGVLVGILPKLGLLGSVIAIVGVVFVVLGLLEML